MSMSRIFIDLSTKFIDNLFLSKVKPISLGLCLKIPVL